MKTQVWWQTQLDLLIALKEQAPKCYWGGVARRKSPWERMAWHLNKALKPIINWFVGEAA